MFQNKQSQHNQNIINHLTQLIRCQLDNKNSLKGLDKLQIYSHFLRTNQFKFKNYLNDNQLKQKLSQQNQYTTYLKDLAKLKDKITKLDKGKIFAMPDLIQQYNALKIAGISIGQTNSLHLSQAIKTLAIQNQTKQIKFWGKILGFQDYFVIQGISSKLYLNQNDPSIQQYGTGVNSYSYWVSTNILGNWTQLPIITPTQIKGSRQFKYIFTGNLQKDIFNGKNFNGKQKHLLKCTIARITHACQIVPKGLYKVTQENPNIVDFEDQFKVPQVSQMNAIENWVHLNAHILGQGRTTHYIDPKLSQEQKEALTAELAQKDPMIERLKGISQDKPYQALGYTSNWTAQLLGETVPVNLIGKQQGQSSIYGVTLLKNLSWPGSFTVGYRGGWVNIYIGYGHRISQVNNLIKEIPDLAIEGGEKTQKSEPNPAKAPQAPKNEEIPQQNAEQIPAD